MKRLFCIVLLAFVSGCLFPTEFMTALKANTQADKDFKTTVADTFSAMGSRALTSGDLLKGLGLSGIGLLLGGGGGHILRRNGRGATNG